jgi:hypothetical protein
MLSIQSVSHRREFAALIRLLLLGTFLLSVAMPVDVSGQVLAARDIASQRSPTVVTITTDAAFGSGVIVEPSGLIVTNLHVIRGSLEAQVALSNGDVYDSVTVVAIDERRDLALIRIPGFGLPASPLGDSDTVQPGDSVILIGAPEFLEQTVSSGIVSAVRDSGYGYRLIQTNAAASSGSSGGGMFNDSGELIGIVTAQLLEGQNLNFAVPINYARGLLASSDDEITLAENATRYPDVTGSGSLLEAALRDSGAEYVEVDETTWSIRYEGGNSLGAFDLYISVYSDMALFLAVAIERPTLDSETATALLDLDFQLNLAKVGITPDGALVASHQVLIRLLDGDLVNRIADEVANAADSAASLVRLPFSR